MAFKELAVAGLLIVTAFVVTTGIGSDTGISETFTPYQDIVGNTETSFTGEGSLDNLIVNSEGQLQIDDKNTDASQHMLIGKVSITENGEWENQGTFEKGLQVKDSHDDLLDTYLTEGDGNDPAVYDTSTFYVEDDTLFLDYRFYQNQSRPQINSTLILEDDTGTEVDSLNLTTGSPDNGYLETGNLTVPTIGDYSLQVEFFNGTEDDYRLYTLRAWQNTDAYNVGSGDYRTSIRQTGDRLVIDEVDVVTEDTTELGSENARAATITFYGQAEGRDVERTFFVGSGGLVFIEDVFPNTDIQTYQYEIRLATETSLSPKIDQTVIRGNIVESSFAIGSENLLGTALFIIIIGMALLYAAASLGRR